MRRRFLITDAMALVGATAIGCAAIRDWAGPVFLNIGQTTFTGILSTATVYITTLTYFWSVAVLILGLQRPRPPLRRLCRQPGLAGCLSVVLTSLMMLLGNAATLLDLRSSSRYWSLTHDLLLAAMSTINLAPSIVVAWAVLALSRRWRPTSGWIDRLGRSVGITLLSLYVVQLLSMYYVELF
jgi:hypothetical protein